MGRRMFFKSSCDENNKNIVKGLTISAKSIKKFIYYLTNFDDNYISASSRLIENQNDLNEIRYNDVL
jgi:hypothetical protein